MATQKKTEAKPAAATTQPPAPAPPNEETGFETVMVVQTTEEPVRRGGHVLTDKGWVLEDN